MKKHKHQFKLSKTYSPDYFKEVCSCGDWRRVRRINAGLHEYHYSSGEVREVRVK